MPAKLFFCFIVFCLLICRQIKAEESITLRVVEFNIRGLPNIISRDHAKRRIKNIVKNIEKTDIILFQENFAFKKLVSRHLPQYTWFYGNGSRLENLTS